MIANRSILDRLKNKLQALNIPYKAANNINFEDIKQFPYAIISTQTVSTTRAMSGHVCLEQQQVTITILHDQRRECDNLRILVQNMFSGYGNMSSSGVTSISTEVNTERFSCDIMFTILN